MKKRAARELGACGFQVSNYQERDPRVREEAFWGDGMDSTIRQVYAVRIVQPKGVELGTTNRFLGGDVEGHHVNPVREPC